VVRVGRHRDAGADRRVPERRGARPDRLRECGAKRGEKEAEVARIKNEAASEEAAPECDRRRDEERGGGRVPSVLQNRFTSSFRPSGRSTSRDRGSGKRARTSR